MSRFEACLILFALVFVVVIIVYNFIIYRRQMKKKDFEEIIEIKYLVSRFKIRILKEDYKKTLFITSVVNGFIIGITSVIIIMLDLGFIWQFLVGFVILLALIYLCYEILGIILKKKGKNIK